MRSLDRFLSVATIFSSKTVRISILKYLQKTEFQSFRSVEDAEIEGSSEFIPTVIPLDSPRLLLSLLSFLLLEFRQWQSRADRVLILNLNSTVLENLELCLGP